jgi:hypothetical protein
MAENTVLDEEIFSFEDEEDFDEEEVEVEEDDSDYEEDDSEEYEEDYEDYEEEEYEEEEYEEPPSKKQQTPEENARFAEMRRQSIIDQRVKEELTNSVEYRTAQILSEMYGVTPEQLYQKIEEGRVARQAEEQGIPLEVARSLEQYKNELGTYQQKLQQLEFQSWSSQIDSQANEIKKQFPMLTDDDLHDSKVYLLQTIRNPNMPLEQAVFALHGAKITNSYRSNVRNEVLAEVSGRKKGALPPQTRKASTAQSLSQDEVLAAKALGVSIDDYLKFKD